MSPVLDDGPVELDESELEALDVPDFPTVAGIPFFDSLKPMWMLSMSRCNSSRSRRLPNPFELRGSRCPSTLPAARTRKWRSSKVQVRKDRCFAG